MTLHTPTNHATEQATRTRPRVHFTADDGWINDPYGVIWLDDRYHLFYQALPGRTTWAPDCAWGHAESADLVHWTELPPPLEPQAFEKGCWSGSVVADGPDKPVLFYTRITGDDWNIGTIARADGSTNLRNWTTSFDDVVINGPTSRLGVRTFRDPFVFRHGDEWVMVVGAGLSDGSGAAVQYRSSDLKTWTCDGLICSRLSNPYDDVWTGTMWECPQLFALDDDWVLLVSVWDQDVLHYVAAALGDYDGRRFVPRTWQRLTQGSCAYAMSTFVDREGRRCVMSWLREEPQNNPELADRAGAHSVPAVLTRDSGQLVLTPHPNLLTRANEQAIPAASNGETRLAGREDAVELTLTPSPGQRMLVTNGGIKLAALQFGATRRELCITRPGLPDGHTPIVPGRELHLILDADLLEIFGSDYGAFRIGISTDPRATEIVLSAPHPKCTLRVM